MTRKCSEEVEEYIIYRLQKAGKLNKETEVVFRNLLFASEDKYAIEAGDAVAKNGKPGASAGELFVHFARICIFSHGMDRIPRDMYDKEPDLDLTEEDPLF